MQSFGMLKQVVHIVTTGLSRVKWKELCCSGRETWSLVLMEEQAEGLREQSAEGNIWTQEGGNDRRPEKIES
jgi:hypothetical protein